MQKTVISVAVLLCLSAFVLGASADGDGKQSGDNSDCVDYNALYNVPGLHSPGAVLIDVNEGADYELTSDSGVPFIDFHDAGGNWLSFGNSGEVPSGATYGSICVTVDGGYPSAPMPLATWTYSES